MPNGDDDEYQTNFRAASFPHNGRPGPSGGQICTILVVEFSRNIRPYSALYLNLFNIRLETSRGPYNRARS